MTDSLRCFLVQEAIHSCREDHPSAKALCWEDAVRVIKVIALKQQAPFGKEETGLSFGFHFGGWMSLLKRELEESRGSPGNRENSQAGPPRRGSSPYASLCCYTQESL